MSASRSGTDSVARTETMTLVDGPSLYGCESGAYVSCVVPQCNREEDGPRIPPRSPLLFAADRSRKPPQSRGKLVDKFPGINLGEIRVIDNLNHTPETTPVRRKVVNPKADNWQEWVAESQPQLTPRKEEYATSRNIRMVGTHEPWIDPSLQDGDIEAHGEHAVRSALWERFSYQPTIKPGGNDQSSWNKRRMIHQLGDERLQFLSEHAKRTVQIEGRERRPHLPREVDQLAAVDVLLTHDASKSDRRRVAIGYPTDQSPETIQSRRKLGDFLTNLMEHRTDDAVEVALMAPWRARRETVELERPDPKHGPRNDRCDYLALINEHDTAAEGFEAFRKQHADHAYRQHYIDSQIVRPDEEVDMLDFDEKDELEDVFDEPNTRVGIYDIDETDFYTGKLMQAEVSSLKKTKKNEKPVDVDGFLLRTVKYDEQELNERVEMARQNLVRRKKLLPPGSAWQWPNQTAARQPVVRTRTFVPKKKASPKKTASPKKKASPKRKPTKTQSERERSSQPYRPPNDNQQETRRRGGGMRVPLSLDLTGSDVRELPARDDSPITEAGDVNLPGVPEGLEQLDGSGEQDDRSGLGESVATEWEPPAFHILAALAAIRDCVGTSQVNRSVSITRGVLQDQGRSDRAGDETSVPADPALPVSGVKRSFSEMMGELLQLLDVLEFRKQCCKRAAKVFMHRRSRPMSQGRPDKDSDIIDVQD